MSIARCPPRPACAGRCAAPARPVRLQLEAHRHRRRPPAAASTGRARGHRRTRRRRHRRRRRPRPPRRPPADAAAPPHRPPAAPPQGPAPVAGTDYVEIAGGQPFAPLDGKIEVVEVFGYTCPHCAQFEPLVSRLEGKQPADVRVTPVPAAFGGYWAPTPRPSTPPRRWACWTRPMTRCSTPSTCERSLPAEGARPTSRSPRSTPSTASTPSSSPAPCSSFAVDAKLNRAKQFAVRAAGSTARPRIVVNGKYRVSVASAATRTCCASPTTWSRSERAALAGAGEVSRADPAHVTATDGHAPAQAAQRQHPGRLQHAPLQRLRDAQLVARAAGRQQARQPGHDREAGRRARHRRPAGERPGQPAFGLHQPDPLPGRARRLRLLEPPAQPPRRRRRLQRQRPAEQARAGAKSSTMPCPAASAAAACCWRASARATTA